MSSVRLVKESKTMLGRQTMPGLVGHGSLGRGWAGAGGSTHNLPHGLGWHAGVAVHQGLCRLWEGVGHAVAEALS